MAHAQGTKFMRAPNASPLVFAQVAGLVSLNDIDLTRDAIDGTLLDSVAGYRAYEGNQTKNIEPFDLVLHFDQTIGWEADLKADFEQNAPGNYRIVLPLGSPNVYMEFQGVITKFGISLPQEDRITRNITIQPSDELTFSWIP